MDGAWLVEIDDINDPAMFGVMYHTEQERDEAPRPAGHTPEMENVFETLVRTYIDRTVPEAWLACPFTCQTIVEISAEGYHQVIECFERFGVDPHELEASFALLTD